MILRTLLCSHTYSDAEGPVVPPGRLVKVTAWLSDDDGARADDRNRAQDGEILFAKFTEDDVLAKSLLNPKSRLRVLISRPLKNRR